MAVYMNESQVLFKQRASNRRRGHNRKGWTEYTSGGECLCSMVTVAVGLFSQGNVDTLPPDRPERDLQAYRVRGKVTVEFDNDGGQSKFGGRS